MSFTQDELQAFNTILDQKLASQRRELERTFDQRLSTLKREFDQRLTALQQDMLRNVPQRVSEQQNVLKDALSQRLDHQQARMSDILMCVVEQQQQFADLVEHSLAAQLLAFEQLINQGSSHTTELLETYENESQPEFGSIEFQTEIPLEALAELISKALDARLVSLGEAVQDAVSNLERYLSLQMHSLRDDLARGQSQPFNGTATNMQDIFVAIDQLERVIESMQVAMTANHALLSNRLYHHQQLAPERAHPGSHTSTSSEEAPTPNGANNPGSLPTLESGK